jgi:transposase
MAIIGGFDLHRRQLTYDYLDVVTGQVDRGRVVPADRGHLRSLLARFEGQGEVAFAVEGCTGWRYVVEELERAGIGAHLAEPAETAAKRGRKRRAKTDRSDARHLRELLVKGDLPESWIPPAQVLEARARCGCIRTWRRSARRGCSGSRPPCTTRACRSSSRSPAPLARPA